MISFFVNASTSALVLLWMGSAVLGVALLMRKRWAGGLLLLEGVLGAAAHLALSLVPVSRKRNAHQRSETTPTSLEAGSASGSPANADPGGLSQSVDRKSVV